MHKFSFFLSHCHTKNWEQVQVQNNPMYIPDFLKAMFIHYALY